MARKKTINPTSRVKSVELAGKPHSIEFNFKAYAAMKELTGVSLLKGWDDSELDAKEYACLLFSGLITHHPDIEIEFCFAALSDGDFVEIIRVLFDAYRASLPKPKDEPANPTKPSAKS